MAGGARSRATRYCRSGSRRFVCRVRLQAPLPRAVQAAGDHPDQLDPGVGLRRAGLRNGPTSPLRGPLPNPRPGVGDHPIGGSSWLMGVFNMPTATHYLVEVGPSPLGFVDARDRPDRGVKHGSADRRIRTHAVTAPARRSRWYEVADIFLFGRWCSPVGENASLLADPGDGLDYLRLRVKDGGEREGELAARRAGRQHGAPAQRCRDGELVTPSGEAKPLKCDQVKKGDGLIRITVKASNPTSATSAWQRGQLQPVRADRRGPGRAPRPRGAAVEDLHGNVAETATRCRPRPSGIRGATPASSRAATWCNRHPRPSGAQQRVGRRSRQRRLGGDRDRFLAPATGRRARGGAGADGRPVHPTGPRKRPKLAPGSG